MHISKKKSVISILLVFAMLLSPFGNISMSVRAEGEDTPPAKNITVFKLTLKDSSNNSFPAANNCLTNKRILDASDFDFSITYQSGDETKSETLKLETTDDSTVYKDADGISYTVDDSKIDEISAKIGEKQAVSAVLKYKAADGTDKSITSTDNPEVNIFSSKEVINPKKISLKLKNKDVNTFYAATSDALDSSDTLDSDNLELLVTYDVRFYKDDYDNTSADDTKRYEIKEETETMPITSTNEYTIRTNVEEVRKTIGEEQELWAELEYKTKDSEGKEKTVTIRSKSNKPSDNPIVNIINASSTRNLSSIALELKADSKKKSFYVDNGLMKADELLSLSDFNLKLTYENGKTVTKDDIKALSSDDIKVTTNVETIKKHVGKNQEITAKLTYKDKDGKDVTLQTITADDVTAAKKKDPNTTLKATTAKVTILAPYAINGVVTVTPQNFGAKATDIYTDKAAIQDALDLACADYKLLINFPAGEYYIGGPLYIHSNTTLKLDNLAAIIRNADDDKGSGKTGRDGVNHNLLKASPYNSKKSETVGGYTNAENIVIEGGIFDGGNISKATTASNVLNLGHINNLTIKNTTVKNAFGNHLIELVAVQNAEITGCTFTGFRYVKDEINDDDGGKSYADPNGDLAEAIQIDVAHEETKTDGTISKWTSAYLTDDTPCANIKIHDNTFNDYPVAIGNHHSLDGHHHTNIEIANNKINGTSSQNSGIKLFGCDNSLVSGNTITNYSTGIKASASNGFTVQYNNITSATYGIIDTDASSGQIVSNTIDKLTNQGIIVYGAGTTASVVGLNTISNSKKSGILVHSGASCETVSSNKISTCTEDGISVYSSGKVNSLKTNTISYCQNNGIEVCGFASIPSITDNTINNSTGRGIYVYGSANVPSITKNKITQTGASGIEINTKAVATNLKKNTINKCSKYGIYVAGSASVKTLSSNTIKNTVKNGIYVKNDKIKLTFKSNKLTRVGSTAIKVDSKLSAKKKQKYTFAPKVISLNLGGGVMTTQASNLKKIKLKVGSKTYTKSTSKKSYTFKFKKYTKKASSATVTFTDKNKNTVARVLDFE